MARELNCNDVFEGCEAVVVADTDDEVMAVAAQHAADDHGVDEVDDETAAVLQAAIHDA
jgi:predicted small metal-binding protein